MSDSTTISRESGPAEVNFQIQKPSSIEQISNIFKQDHKDFMMGKVGKLSVNLTSTALTNITLGVYM